MKKFCKTIIVVFTCTIILSLFHVIGYAASAFPSETDPFVSNYYIDKTNKDKPFFDVVLPEIAKNIKTNNKHSISPYYDKLPLANNPENFQGLGSTTYANINGKVVTAEAFYRVKGDSLCDPNNGMGLLIYQCIQYKRAHPEEDVKITFSSYRTSASAAVCVLPESKYYGYMRSLFGTNYDEHGFVRISFMLTEAARMGIEVTMINQLPSYGVNQYNPSTGTLKTRTAMNYVTYFNQAIKTDCYNKYAPGKKVSDFMNFVKVGWTVEDKTGDMQHVKSATVSHYLATDGTEHRNAVFFSSSNLDDNDYKGSNGNGKSQSGVIVSDHADLYRVTYNYMQLMYKYSGQEDMFTLRKLVNEMNNEQAALINSGKGDKIPKDEQIIYLGTKNDPVFELYFTPFGGSSDVWDSQMNPFCKYLDKLPSSKDYVEFIWNEYGYGKCNIGSTMEKILEKTFCENPNVKNKFAIRVTDFNTDAIKQLALGSQIGYRSINSGANVHSKDILMSYEENGVRHRVSLMTSCNFYMVAFNYRTNSMLVINETDKTGGNFYNIFGEKYSDGMINNDLMVTPANLVLEVGQSYNAEAKYSGKGTLSWTSSKKDVATVNNGKISALKPGTSTITVTDGNKKATVKLTVVECIDCVNADQGLTCNIDEQYVLSKKLNAMPITFEAVFSVEQKSLTGTTTLLGSDGNFDPAMVFSLNKSGQPRVAIRDKADYSVQSVYVFKDVNVATGEKVHLSIVTDFENKKMHCYVNGKLAQTITDIASVEPFENKHNFVVGGDHLNGNATHFTGFIESVAVWSDIRTASEIAADYSGGIKTSDKNLLAAYDLTLCNDCMKKDLSANGNNLEHVILWQDAEDVEPVTDYEYSFAVVGDTQTMCENDPEAMESIYDWILANKDLQKIEFVIGLGDITDNSTDREWTDANKYISKLNGKIPYVLSRGNHDDWDDFNRNLHDGFYEKTIDGMMVSGNVSLTDPNQPGLIKTTQPDGAVSIVTRNGDVPEGGTVKGDLTNSYRYFNIQGTDYLIMTLDFAPSEAVLNWANSVIEAHPHHKVIVVTHAYMYRDGTTIDDGDCYPPTYYSNSNPDAQNGDDMWEKCFSKHENVLMVLSGHDPWQNIVYRQDKGENCNTVTQMLIDAQYVDRNIGSTAMVAMFYFSNDGNTLTVRYYSVEKDCYGSVASQFTIDLNKSSHTYKTTTTKATLTNNGNTKTACTVCGFVKSNKIYYSPKTVTLSATEYTYDGTVKSPTVTIKDSKGKTLKEGTDYTVSYAGGRKNVGTYKVTVTMKGNYSGTKTLTFKINPINISTCTVKLSATSYTYDGTVKAPTVTVKNAKGTTLSKGTHYTVTYASGRKNVGTYKVTVTMKGNYSGTKTLTFKINPINISTCSVKLSSTSYTYDGAVKAPTVTVKNAKGTTLSKGTHYTVTYASGRKNVGTYKVTVTMKGNYSGTKTLTFKINPISISKCTVKLSATNFTYNGSVKTPTVTVKNAKGTTLTKGTHYTVTYASGRKSVGAYKVTVTMKGNYSGTKTLSFYVLPGKTSKITPTAATTSINATWNKVTGASGYRVELLNANGKVLKKVTTTKLTYTFSGLSAGTTYKVRVTAYKTISGTNKYSLSSTTLTTATKPATPTLTVSSTTKGKASFSWKNVSGESGYQVYYSTNKSSNFTKVASYSTDTLKGSKSSLTSGKTYYFKVRAYKKVGNTVVYGGWSTVKSVKIK